MSLGFHCHQFEDFIDKRIPEAVLIANGILAEGSGRADAAGTGPQCVADGHCALVGVPIYPAPLGHAWGCGAGCGVQTNAVEKG